MACQINSKLLLLASKSLQSEGWELLTSLRTYPRCTARPCKLDDAVCSEHPREFMLAGRSSAVFWVQDSLSLTFPRLCPLNILCSFLKGFPAPPHHPVVMGPHSAMLPKSSLHDLHVYVGVCKLLPEGQIWPTACRK